MQVARLELCKELYELSGWKSTGGCKWFSQANQPHLAEQKDSFFKPVADTEADMYNNYPYFEEVLCPAYDLGFLLRKLPRKNTFAAKHADYIERARDCLLFLHPTTGANIQWMTGYQWQDSDNEKTTSSYISGWTFYGDTPEDAVCKLAIELFKQGILERQ